jgi:hypothetical protein
MEWPRPSAPSTTEKDGCGQQTFRRQDANISVTKNKDMECHEGREQQLPRCAKQLRVGEVSSLLKVMEHDLLDMNEQQRNGIFSSRQLLS